MDGPLNLKIFNTEQAKTHINIGTPKDTLLMMNSGDVRNMYSTL